jgi:spermidine synthase
LYESNLSSAKSMIATFFKVFREGILFSNDQHLEGYDAVLLGGAEPSRLDLDNLNQMMDEEKYLPVKESLIEVGFGAGGTGFESPNRGVINDLYATYAARGSDLQTWTADAQINRDKNLRLQYLAGMWFNSYEGTSILQSILAYYKFPKNLFAGSPEHIENLKQALENEGRREH